MTKKIEPDEEVVEMRQGEDGKFYPIATVKVQDQPMIHNNTMKNLPRWFPAIYEVVDGFVMGLGAIENFVWNMKRLNRRRKNVHLD